MDIGIMKTYTSKTGYVRRSTTGECYEAETLYCPDGADLSVYEDISKRVYSSWVKKQEAEMAKAIAD